MRPPLGVDLLMFARALLAFPVDERPEIAREMLKETDIAEDYFDRKGKPHPAFGDGSLLSRLLKDKLAAEPFANVPAFLTALSAAVEAMKVKVG